jgi:hypothetical protein
LLFTAIYCYYPKTNLNALYFNNIYRPTGEYAKLMLEKLSSDFYVKGYKGRGLLYAAAGGDE